MNIKKPRPENKPLDLTVNKETTATARARAWGAPGLPWVAGLVGLRVRNLYHHFYNNPLKFDALILGAVALNRHQTADSSGEPGEPNQ